MTEYKYCPECTKPLEPKKDNDGVVRPACPSGHFVLYDNPSSATSGLVEHDGKYLIVKRGHEPGKGEWDLPGGFMEGDEPPEQAVHRELKEETGLDVTIGQLIGAYSAMFHGRPILSIAYHCTAPSDAVQLSDENPEYKWLPLERFPKMASDCDQQAIDAFIKLKRVG